MKKKIILLVTILIQLLSIQCRSEDSLEDVGVNNPKSKNEIASKIAYIRETYVNNKTKKNSGAWMSYLYPNTRLLDITIPGTHDSPARAVPDWANCQHGTIQEQLDAGIRYFDVRLNFDNNDLPAYHGPYYLGQNFDDIISTIRNFLIQNNKEVVIIQVKKENSDNNKDQWVNLYETKISQYASQGIMDKTWNPKDPISSHYGKILPITRETQTTMWYTSWGDNNNFDIGLSNAYNKGFVQDNYYFSSIFWGSMSYKLERVYDTIYRAQLNSQKDKFIINYLSGNGLATPVAIADRINPETAKYMANYMVQPYGTSTPLQYGFMKRSGWIIMDFANSTHGESVIDACITQSIIANSPIGSIFGFTSGYLPN